MLTPPLAPPFPVSGWSDAAGKPHLREPVYPAGQGTETPFAETRLPTAAWLTAAPTLPPPVRPSLPAAGRRPRRSAPLAGCGQSRLHRHRDGATLSPSATVSLPASATRNQIAPPQDSLSGSGAVEGGQVNSRSNSDVHFVVGCKRWLSCSSSRIFIVVLFSRLEHRSSTSLRAERTAVSDVHSPYRTASLAVNA